MAGRRLSTRGNNHETIRAKIKDDAEYEKYMVLLFCWEDRKMNPSLAAVTVAADIPGSLKTRTVQCEKRSLSASTSLGIVWPIHIYEKIEGKKPDKKDIGVWEIHGEQVKGVLRNKDCGCQGINSCLSGFPGRGGG
eukprot:9484009-Pyramimonas_sp.AAC.1